MAKIEEKVFCYIEEYQMIMPGDRLILGVSGGADSVCLLFLLLEYRKKVPFEIAVVHIDHGIRGKEAEEDAGYVEKLCREYALPFRRVFADVRKLAEEEKCSEEDAGRRVRYKAFRKASEELGGTRIAVAHHAGDRAETMLLHLFRGSGLRGLCGIEPVRDELIRPLLCLERAEIEEYLQERGIPWREDRTNAGEDYTRNRVRHHILPVAEREVSRGVVSHMCRTADILSEAENYMAGQTREALADCTQCMQGGDVEIDVDGFLKFHPAIQKRMILCLAEGLSDTGKDITARNVEDVRTLFCREGNRDIDLSMGIRFRRRYGKVMASRGGERAAHELPTPQYTEFSAEAFAAYMQSCCERETFIINWEKIPAKPYTKWFDYDKIKKLPEMRFRRTGDYLTISDGKGGIIRKALQDYMVTEKIPREQRDSIPLLAEDGHVLWLVGYRISEYYKVDRNTKRVLQVKI